MILLGGKITVHAGDCLEVIRTLASDSVDSCVTDPPYNLGFMGRAWDKASVAFTAELWREVLRVLKPGAHLVAFGGTRTFHRLACAIEDAGFEIRDQIQWVYGSGFPKSHDVSKGIDKAAGAEREVVGRYQSPEGTSGSSPGTAWFNDGGLAAITAPSTPEAQQWQGWGTALKPAVEPVLYGAKPLTAAQVFGIVIGELSPRLIQCLNLNASDAEALSSAIQAKLHAAGAHTVLEPAKMRVLASIEAASFAELASICPQLGFGGSSKTRGSFAPGPAKENGNPRRTPERTTHSGAAADISTLTADIITSLLEGENTSESIASLWSEFSVAALGQTNRFTTSTATRLITDLRTLRSLLHPSISSGIGNLSPNSEPICLARKPLSEGTVAANVLRWGTGAINIDGSRVGTGEDKGEWPITKRRHDDVTFTLQPTLTDKTLGRWPANLIHDGSDEVLAAFPETESHGGGTSLADGSPFSDGLRVNAPRIAVPRGDTGSAARFFYSAKADSDDRLGSSHPTVKPLNLMQYLVRLVTPPGGTVLDPFAGSGTTGEAAVREGCKAVLVEREPEYLADIERRCSLILAGPVARLHATIKAKGTAEDHGPLFEVRP